MQNNEASLPETTEITLVLYSTEGCHLCEEAIQLLQEAGCISDVEIIDIIEHDALVSAYGEHIPVLHHLPSNIALFWPFTAPQLIEFYKEHHGSSQN